jgi:hypothetical protein
MVDRYVLHFYIALERFIDGLLRPKHVAVLEYVLHCDWQYYIVLLNKRIVNRVKTKDFHNFWCVLNGQIFVNYFTLICVPWQRTTSTGCGHQFKIALHIMCYCVRARGFFWPKGGGW